MEYFKCFMQTSFRLWGIPSVFSWVTSFQTPKNPLSSIHLPAHTTLAKHILLFPVAPRPPCWIPTAVWCTVLLLVAPIAQTTRDKPKFEGSFHQLPEDPQFLAGEKTTDGSTAKRRDLMKLHKIGLYCTK